MRSRVKIISDGTTAGTLVVLIDEDGAQHEIEADGVTFECERGGLCYATLTIAAVEADIDAEALDG